MIPEFVWIWIVRLIWGVEVAIAFGLLVMVHEFGHFIIAKWTGMKVEEFSIGFGKRLIGKKQGETEYSIRLIPLGGYCKIYGMEDEEDEKPSEEDTSRAFNNKPWMARFMVLIAGSMMNLVLGILLVAFAGTIIGFNYSLIYDVVKGGPADVAGIKTGDKVRLFAYNSKSIDIGQAVRNSDPAQGVTLNLINDEGSRTIAIHPEMEIAEDGKTVKRIGVIFDENGNYTPKIDSVLLDSPYYKAGLLPGDIITEIDGKPVLGISSVMVTLMETPNEMIDVKVKRGENEFKFELKDFQIRRTGLVAGTVGTQNGFELVIKNVIFDTPAMSAMLKPGMRIVEVNGKPITKNFDWSEYELMKGPVWISLKIIDPKQDSQPFIVELPRVMAHPGINFKADWIKVPFHQAVIEASRQAWVFSTMIYGFLGGLFTEKVGMGDIMGPVGIISFTYKAASWGIVQFIIVLSMFSINLNIINLLPFPGLDGGRLVFLIAELIARKPLMKAKVENMIHFIGFCLLFALIILVTYFDFHRIFVQ